MKISIFTRSLTVILPVLLMTLLIVGCSPASTKQETQDASSQTQDTTNSTYNSSQDSELIALFVKDFNDSTQRKLESTDPITLDDSRANATIKQYFSSVFNNSNSDIAQNIYSYPKSNTDSLHPINYLGVSVGDIASTKVITVCGMFGKSEQMIDAFHSAFLLLSNDATQSDFDQLENEETFSYGGKSGETAGIQYEVSSFGGYHTILLTAPTNNLNLAS